MFLENKVNFRKWINKKAATGCRVGRDSFRAGKVGTHTVAAVSKFTISGFRFAPPPI
jgi:hypothetical protein